MDYFPLARLLWRIAIRATAAETFARDDRSFRSIATPARLAAARLKIDEGHGPGAVLASAFCTAAVAAYACRPKISGLFTFYPAEMTWLKTAM